MLSTAITAHSMDDLRTVDILKARLPSAVIVLGYRSQDRVNFIAYVSRDLVARGLHAGQIVKLPQLSPAEGRWATDRLRLVAKNLPLRALAAAVSAAKEKLQVFTKGRATRPAFRQENGLTNRI